MPNKLANLAGAGFPAQAANYLTGQPADNLTALGTTQATALLIATDYNVVTTTAAGTGVVFSTNTQPGDDTFVKNLGANALLVYPALGESIDALAANAGYSLAAGKSAYFAKSSNTRWVSLLSA